MSRPTRPEDDPPEEGPSKGQRKREAHAAQELGEQLIGLPDAELDALQLPERLHDAVVAARSIGSRGGGLRQRQYIGKLMRDIDPTAIRAALAARAAHADRETRRFHRVESWRARLVQEDAAALDDLKASLPELDTAALQPLIEAARAERARTGASGPASRELFRALREALD